MTQTLPERTRTYLNHHLDSGRWDHYRPRDGDVVVTTSLKAGTTWMQRIVSLLVFGPDEMPGSLWHVSPWIDQRFVEPIDAVIERIEAQEHRRFLKSHLAFDGLPYHPEVRYIFVARDTRDVFMSLWNHYGSYTPLTLNLLAAGDPPGGPCPPCPDDIVECWRAWITRGWFPWEEDGWPFWSHHHHASTYWAHRGLPNLLLVHFQDLLGDLPTQMRRVADFLGIEVGEERWPALVEAATFATMKADAERLVPEAAFGFEGGAQRFIHQGTNGRWRDLLGDADLALYEEAAQRLDPGLRAWLETGGVPAPPDPAEPAEPASTT